MAYQIEFDEDGLRDFELLDNSVKLSVKKYFKKLISVENPKAYGKALTGNLAGCWRFRVEDYRIGAKIQDNKLVILIIAIDHRRKIYKELSKRLKKQ